MTKHERSSRPDRLSLGRSADPMLDALLDRAPLPDEDPARWQPVAQVLTALTSAPESSELAGEARALAAFRNRARGVPVLSRARRRNRGWAASLPVPRPAVAAATGIVAMGGLLAVAYAGDLPAAAQRLAHDTIGAPAAARDSGPGSRPAASPGPASPLTRTASQGSSSSGYGPSRPDRRVTRRHSSGLHTSAGRPVTRRAPARLAGQASTAPVSTPRARGLRARAPGRPAGLRAGLLRPCPPSSRRRGRAPAPRLARPRRRQPCQAPASSPGTTMSRRRPLPESFPPDHPPPPVAAAGAVRRAGSQPPRGLGPSPFSLDRTCLVRGGPVLLRRPGSLRAARFPTGRPGRVSGGNPPRWCSPR